jgi:hypothetical protein
MATGLLKPVHLATDGTNLYWGEYLGGGIFSMPVAGGAAPKVVAAAVQPTEIATDGVDVYWLSDAAQDIHRAPVGGGSPTTVFSGLWSIRNLRLNTPTVFVTELGQDGATRLHGYDKVTFGAFSALLDPLAIQEPDTLAVDDADAYVASPDSGPANTTTSWVNWPVPVSLSGAPKRMIVPRSHASRWSGIPTRIVLDPAGSDLFFASPGYVSAGPDSTPMGIYRTVRGCFSRWPTPVVLNPTLKVKVLGLDAGYVYWTDGTSIQRIVRP